MASWKSVVVLMLPISSIYFLNKPEGMDYTYIRWAVWRDLSSLSLRSLRVDQIWCWLIPGADVSLNWDLAILTTMKSTLFDLRVYKQEVGVGLCRRSLHRHLWSCLSSLHWHELWPTIRLQCRVARGRHLHRIHFWPEHANRTFASWPVPG